jgi:hypothetical protein
VTIAVATYRPWSIASCVSRRNEEPSLDLEHCQEETADGSGSDLFLSGSLRCDKFFQVAWPQYAPLSLSQPLPLCRTSASRAYHRTKGVVIAEVVSDDGLAITP